VVGWPRWTGVTVLSAVIAAGVSPELHGIDERPDPPAEEPEHPPRPFPPSKTPIADSVEAAVERFIRERLSPCGTSDGVPCFPVTVEVQGRRYSVRETLDDLEFDSSRPVPDTPPTAAEMIQHGANPRPTSAAVGFDPKAIVCKTKQLIEKIQGRSRKYYLYRVWDETGERAVLRDRPLDPNALAGSPHFRYLPLGEFGDECEAIRAYVTSTHDVRARREAESAEPTEEPDLDLRSDREPD